ncbi:Retrovirus-related Pol polyprotein from transposon opus [Gossypium australe]|uniref:Retrovirus-related Pol polyprotein from transposon opus n=1 Tax=Gossypium australe TaxID=47621 RepID=A0A5B6UIR1_9ROSI|nr:Retrovirus-related Pol polyprotein from transposon opus [Gossypium australe]
MADKSSSFRKTTQSPSQYDVVSYVYCADGHSSKNFPSNPESVYYSNQGNGPNNTRMQHKPNQAKGFNQHAQKPPQTKSSNSLENLLKAYMVKNDVLIQSQAATLKNLENQMGQLATELRSRAQRALPSNRKYLRNLGNEYETIALTKECSAFLLNKLPLKLKDPGSFTIPGNIGESYYGKALCDLGASINLMFKSIFKLMGIGEVRPTTITPQLVNQSLAYPEGKIEDVLVRLDKFIFPTGFSILDFEVDKDVSIILGRPFLATRRFFVDVQKSELMMRVQDNKVTFNIPKAMKFPNSMEECSVVEEVETLVFMGSNSKEDPLENTSGSEPFEDEKVMKVWL